ncbi:ligase-associated DNA damage response DEXH box helicase [Leptothrix discophora]|uniref:Ligase-associated DNA damage response DEXH box helicase n=1 Tax=Leptothrix discophora TaxID=89 RepID=A0ABT9G1J6_LEPDI|nr:ligase-associated DNA damage response DEXH box helicase [Leptothrix discophora]MDP4300048.1 ligase-associated DNA damage response DEXH box helicase [Leptothrix discophora]
MSAHPPDDPPWRGGLPPGPNVGTQLSALRRAQARRERATSAPARSPGPSTPRRPAGPVAADAEDWFARRGWQPFDFQREVWAHMRDGRSGLLHATTGAGKTLAAWFGALAVCRARPEPPARTGPRVLWITPMRALAADTTQALQAACDGIGMGWTVAMRTGDTAAAEKARQRHRWPPALVTTPESLSLMLALADGSAVLADAEVLIVDEWHELLGNKRGTQVMLALARMRRLNPALRVWGLSATLGNLALAAEALAGPDAVRVQGSLPKALTVDTLLPETLERFPWGGHLGLRLRDEVVREIDAAASCLVFTNTRSQAEVWYQSLLEARPDWAGLIALHHGSLDPAVRQWVEAGLKNGALKAVVCTSSLDLGVDFLPVERVLQIGSPKGIARLLQRAGRSGHAPGRPSRITVVPTHALEILEGAAAREAALARRIESREPPPWPIDVLIQHLLTLAVGEGFEPDALFDEVRLAWPYRDLDRETFDWCLGFTVHGGDALAAYPEHHRIERDPADGRHRVMRRDVARRHRMAIGTIVSDASMSVQWLNGGRLGSIEEGFLASLREGDCFIFSGRVLQLVRVRDLTAYVKPAPKNQGAVPTWQGGKMPLSSELADSVLALLARAEPLLPALEAAAAERPSTPHADLPDDTPPELRTLAPLLALQARQSALPRTGRLVFELLQSDEGHHLFCYPLAGRMVHIGLGALLAWRAARDRPGTFSLSMNDHGFELLSRTPFDWPALLLPEGPGSAGRGLLTAERLMPDLQQALNATELSQRRFREIVRVAGLVFTGYPGAPRSTRQVQASSSLFFDVFRKFDPGNLLLAQAEAETLAQELDVERLQRCLARMAAGEVVMTRPARITPFGFPLMVERLRERISNEPLNQRVQRLLAELEAAAQGQPAPADPAAVKSPRRRRERKP